MVAFIKRFFTINTMIVISRFYLLVNLGITGEALLVTLWV